MGSFGTGFLESLGGAAHEKVERQHELEMEQKKNELAYQRANLASAMQRGGEFRTSKTDPTKQEWHNYTPDEYINLHQDYADNASKVYGNSPAIKQIYQKVGQVLGAATNHPQWGAEHKVPPPPYQPSWDPTAKGSFAAPAGAPAAAIPAPPAAPAPTAGASPSPAQPSTPPGLAAGKSAPSDDQGISGTVPPVADAAPDRGSGDVDSTMAPPAPGTPGTLESMLAPAKADQTDSSSPPPAAAAPTPEPEPQAALSPVPPPPSFGGGDSTPAQIAQSGIPIPVSGNQMLNYHLSPIQQAQIEQRIALEKNQQNFDQQQAQIAARVANFKKQFGREPNNFEMESFFGMKPPAAMFTPHYDPKVILGSNVLANSTTADGSPFDPAMTYHMVGLGAGGGGVYQPVNMPYQKQVIGNILHAINPYTHEDLGPISSQAVKLPTSTSTISPLTTINAAGELQQHAGSRMSVPGTAPVTGIAPPATGVPLPPGVQPSRNLSPQPMPPTKTPSGSAVPVIPAGSATKSSAPIVKTGGATRTYAEGTLPIGQYYQQQRRNTAINGAGQALQRFTVPQDDTGFSNLDIFKDPDAVNRISSYLKLNNDQIEGQFENAEKDGIHGVASFYLGIPAAYAAASTKAVQDLYNGLTEHDKRFVTDYYALLGQWGGMRAASGASGSLWNFRNLSQEIPNPMSITSYKEAIRKVRDNAAEIAQTAKSNTIATKYKESDFLPQENKKTSAKNGVPAPPGTAGQPQTVYAWDDKGIRHSAPAGTPLPKGWTSVKPK